VTVENGNKPRTLVRTACGSGRANQLISPRTMCSSPTGLKVVALLISLYATPTSMVRPIVSADRFDNVRRLSIASFATIGHVVLARDHLSAADSITLMSVGAVAQFAASPAIFNVSNTISLK
jgi:hypothetical protein